MVYFSKSGKGSSPALLEMGGPASELTITVDLALSVMSDVGHCNPDTPHCIRAVITHVKKKMTAAPKCV